MTIAPPDNSFKSSIYASSQSHSTVKTADEAESQLELREYFSKHGIDVDNLVDDKKKQHSKHHQKHPPSKKTGLLKGLTEKLLKKK